MQPVPAKNRTAVMVGAALLAVVVGSIAVWSSKRGAEPTRPMDEMSMVEEAESVAPAPAPAPTGSSVTQPLQAESVTAAPSSSPSVPAVHTVAPGDTLSSISRQYYNTDIYYGDIEALNEIADPDHLEVGQTLRLPQPEDLQ